VDAVLVYVASSINPGWRPEQSARLIRFDEIRAVEVRGKKIRVNGEVLLKAPSSAYAEFIAQQLRSLSKLSAQQRSHAIRELVDHLFDITSIKTRWEQLQKQTAPLRLLTNILFGYLFICAPILIWTLGLHRTWLGLLLGLLALTTATAIKFHGAHKAFSPAAEDERFSHFLTILLSPATSIRAHEVLSRPLLYEFHPLAIAHVFCPEPQFTEFSRKVLRELRHPGLPVCPREEPLAQAAEQNARALLRGAVEKFLKQAGIDPEALMQPPAPAENECLSFCPRCLAQFTTNVGTCPDCGGLPLEPFCTGVERQSEERKASKRGA
jgi:hypothetical protein